MKPTPITTRKPPGFTLIEVMVVLAIVGLMATTIAVGFGSTRSAQIHEATQRVTNTIRYGYNKAKVTGDYYRLNIDIEKRTFTLQQGSDRMYLPASDRDGKPYVLTEDQLKDQEERDARAADAFNRSIQAGATRDQNPDGTPSSYVAAPKQVPRWRPPLFEGFKEENALSGLAAPIQLPEGVKIVYVRTAEDPAPITKGQGNLYFFPQGRTQMAHIQIHDDETNTDITIKVQPLTGRVTTEDGLVPLELPRSAKDQVDDLGNRGARRSF